MNSTGQLQKSVQEGGLAPGSTPNSQRRHSSLVRSVKCECVYLSVPNTFLGCGLFLHMCEQNILYLCCYELIYILCGIFHQCGLCSWLHLVMQLILCSSSSSSSISISISSSNSSSNDDNDNDDDDNNNNNNNNRRRRGHHHHRLQPASLLH